MKLTIGYFIITGVLSSMLIDTNAAPKPAPNKVHYLRHTTKYNRQANNKTARSFLITTNLLVEINTCRNEGGCNLTVKITGLKESKKKLTLKIDGSVTNSQLADINHNGFPEILIYTQSAEGYGNVICYSVNTDKDITPVALPDIYRNAAASKGYWGHDTFTIENNTLVRKFPLYNLNDAVNKPTGGTRVIKYALVGAGEALRFVISEMSK
jgi:hypothetical protein